MLEKCGLAPVRVEQCHRTVGQARSEHQPRRSVSRPHVHDRPGEGAHDLDSAQSVVDEHRPGLVAILDRRQPGGAEY
jgi:hypothetical protein